MVTVVDQASLKYFRVGFYASLKWMEAHRCLEDRKSILKPVNMWTNGAWWDKTFKTTCMLITQPFLSAHFPSILSRFVVLG